MNSGGIGGIHHENKEMEARFWERERGGGGWGKFFGWIFINDKSSVDVNIENSKLEKFKKDKYNNVNIEIVLKYYVRLNYKEQKSSKAFVWVQKLCFQLTDKLTFYCIFIYFI